MNLVLGAVKGLEIEYIAPFLFSLYQTGFNGEVAFFVSQTNERTHTMLEKLKVTVTTVDESTVFAATPVNSLRYFVYEEILKGYGDEVENILLADVRDIVFQRNPFDFDTQGTITCGLEDRAWTLGNSIINAGWLAAAYGRETMEALAHHPVCCSGATFGPAPLMRDYVHAMTTGLTAIDQRVPNIMHVVGGVDQAVHNYLLRTDALPPARCYGNEDGPFLTLNYVDPDALRFNDDDQVVQEDGAIVPIVHQYDRHPALAERLLTRIEDARQAQ